MTSSPPPDAATPVPTPPDSAPPDSAPPVSGPARRADASMTLLTQVMDRPLDPGYAAAAERRLAQGLPAPRGERSALTLVVLVLLGLLLTAAALQTRGQTTARVAEREQLVAEITRQDAAAARLQAANVALQTTIDAERDRQLQAQAQGGLADEVARLGLVTGALSASGPGLTVTVDDAPVVAAAPGSDPRADTSVEDGRVLDQDLQSVVNGLWAVGAEAVAVNGQRLTALSAIRSAGQAILVDYRPLVPPYHVIAIGDATAMQGAFADSPAGRSLTYLADSFGVRYDVTTSAALVVPGSAGLGIRRAEPPATATATATTTGPATPTSASTATSSAKAKPTTSPSAAPSAIDDQERP